MFRFTFIARDTHVLDLMRALSGKVMELEVVPVTNAKVVNKSIVSQGGFTNMLLEYMRSKDMKEVTGPQAKALFAEFGAPPSSYLHYLNEGIKGGQLKKLGRAGAGNAKRYARVLVREV